LAQKLLGQYTTRIGELTLIPSSGGAFEVSVNGVEVYSKLKTGAFPSEGTLVSEMGSKL